ncbi:thiamine phosphate synthase [Halosquirtibacter laminarini]|uniref:Thiamine phosphate synthase n=1 Tax=Halosquirtibacter laminarini TaxID=3374600 RepID=A0AC61NL35_9BACT|nr:thiamine phosphate synthase [Prolixibacteraceae bacterium]
MKVDTNKFRLQFITHGKTADEILEQVASVLHGGGRWIQFRMKEIDNDSFISIAKEIKKMTDKYDATFIINDHVSVAKEIGASGVHIGMNDTSPAKAREILGDSFIIGGTANTLTTIKEIEQHVDYIGLGPYRYTSTKKNLSAILGLDGYKRIYDEWSGWQQTPIVAIGGIEYNDLSPLLSSSIQGIAVSSSIIKSKTITKETLKWIQKISFTTIN